MRVIHVNEYSEYLNLVDILIKFKMINNTNLYWGPLAKPAIKRAPSDYRIYTIN